MILSLIRTLFKPILETDHFIKLQSRLVNLLEDNRGFVILFFCLPASYIFDSILQFHAKIEKFLFSSPEDHEFRVRKVQEKVAAWNKLPPENRKPLCSARPNWLSLSTTFFDKSECHKIPLNDLCNVLALDEDSMIVKVEPLVSVGDITKFLIPRGYTLAVTLEIADATCGGLALAVGMTTYSHKVGLYQESVTSCDVVLSNGNLVHTTRDNEYSDLFACLPWSHGTLAFLVALELRIVAVKPFVHLEYIPVHGQKDYCDLMRNLSGAKGASVDDPDYLEATVYSKEDAVVMVGRFSEAPPPGDEWKINHVTKWYKPWFYKHCESFLKKGRSHEYIPLREYLLRHNRAIFWVVESMIPFGNHPLFRLLFGWLLPPKPAFLKFTTTPGIRAMTFTKQVFQDIVLPMTVLEDSINLSEEIFDTYPILIYPCRIYDHGPINKGQLRPPKFDQMVPGTNYGMFYDLGVYGVPGKVKRKELYNPVQAMRKMEEFTRDVGGYSFLYADIFMDPSEFGEMFDLTAYEKCRIKYGAKNSFPHLYDKVKPEIDVLNMKF